MTDCAYTQDELQSFYRVLDCVVCEVAERELVLSVFVMINRLFVAADLGVRNPEALRKAILKDDADDRRTVRAAGRRLFLIPTSAEAA